MELNFQLYWLSGRSRPMQAFAKRCDNIGRKCGCHKSWNPTVTCMWPSFCKVGHRLTPPFHSDILISSQKVQITYESSFANFWVEISSLWLWINHPSKTCMSRTYIVVSGVNNKFTQIGVRFVHFHSVSMISLFDIQSMIEKINNSWENPNEIQTSPTMQQRVDNLAGTLLILHNSPHSCLYQHYILFNLII